MTDAELIEACQNNNTKAQEILYNRYAGRLMGVCMRYVNDKEDAKDIFQESFIKIFNNIHKVTDVSTLNAWIKKIVVNTAINYYHKQKKFVQSLNDDIIENEQDESYLKIIDGLSHEELLKLIQKLPQGYKFVFNMYAIEGYTHKEIAEMMNTTESNSKNQYAKAKKSLQKMLNVSSMIEIL
jgi:RNA polymerase sigma factor (sigma-70 family)